MSNPVVSLILAAGEGKRLRPHTNDRPKCMVELGSVPLIDLQIDALKQAGIEDIQIASGYRADMLKDRGGTTFHNEMYATSNMVASMLKARSLFDGSKDVLITYADIVFEPRIITAMLESNDDFSTAIDLGWESLWRLRNEDPLLDAETLKMDQHGWIKEIGKKPSSLDDIEGQYRGIIKVGSQFAKQFIDQIECMDRNAHYDGKDFDNMYMTSLLQYLIDNGCPLKAICSTGGWIEVDTVEDLDTYNQLIECGKMSELYRSRLLDKANA